MARMQIITLTYLVLLLSFLTLERQQTQSKVVHHKNSRDKDKEQSSFYLSEKEAVSKVLEQDHNYAKRETKSNQKEGGFILNFTKFEAINGAEGNDAKTVEESLRHSCTDIREIPVSTRLFFKMDFRFGKYVETYGIPVASSMEVNNRALTRACFLLRFALADYKHVRDMFGVGHGWVNVLGMNELANKLSKYCPLPHWKDGKFFSRAISASWYDAATTIPEENLLCLKEGDAMQNEDFGLHAVSHALHVVALKFVDPHFGDKLSILYSRARKKGMWKNTYAIRNQLEYFAEGVQSYFSVNVKNEVTDSVHGPIYNRERLEKYDPDLHSFLKTVFPCDNVFVGRCEDFWNEITDDKPLKVDYPGCLTEEETIRRAKPKVEKHNLSVEERPINVWAIMGVFAACLVIFFSFNHCVNRCN